MDTHENFKGLFDFDPMIRFYNSVTSLGSAHTIGNTKGLSQYDPGCEQDVTP